MSNEIKNGRELIARLSKTATRSGVKSTEFYGIIAGGTVSVLAGCGVIAAEGAIAQTILMIVPIASAVIFAWIRGGAKQALAVAVAAWEAKKKSSFTAGSCRCSNPHPSLRTGAPKH